VNNLLLDADLQELAKGGKVQALTEAVNALEKELVKTKTQLDISESTVKDDSKRVEAAKKAVKEVRVFDQTCSGSRRL
jgi:structural maintenance of chromosome 2